jgi:hypothetical protein
MPDSWHTLRELEGLQVEGLEQVKSRLYMPSYYYGSTTTGYVREGVTEEKEGGGGRRR